MKTQPLQLISEWAGYLNNEPITVLLRITEDDSQHWWWRAELYWNTQYAIDHSLETGMLWLYYDEKICYDSMTEAHRTGERFLRGQGFQFCREVQ